MRVFKTNCRGRIRVGSKILYLGITQRFKTWKHINFLPKNKESLIHGFDGLIAWLRLVLMISNIKSSPGPRNMISTCCNQFPLLTAAFGASFYRYKFVVIRVSSIFYTCLTMFIITWLFLWSSMDISSRWGYLENLPI